MPRVTPCRFLKVFLFAWLVMIFLWFSLPSPTIVGPEREAHIQNTLASGRPLITVNNWSGRFNPSGRDGVVEGNAYIIRWQLTSGPQGQEVWLGIGDRGASINLTGIVAESHKVNADAGISDVGKLGVNGSSWIPYIGQALLLDDIPTGDSEFSEICLDWFHEADKHMITHEMHGFTNKMAVRFVVPEPGVLELWVENSRSAADWMELTSNPTTWTNVGKSEREANVLAVFKNLETKRVGDVAITDVQGHLPSTTYGIRRALLIPLAPVFSIGWFLLRDVIFQVLYSLLPLLLFIAFSLGLAGAGIMLSCWLRDGRPEFSEWTKTFWMTRWIPRRDKNRLTKVWGPSGPVFARRGKGGEWDEEKSIGLQRPKTVRLGQSWKT